jgi:phosphoserine phosphatase
MHDHRVAGRLVCMVSSSPQEIVEPMARMLQVDRFIATRPRIVDGKYTGDLDFYAYGPHKAAAIQALAEKLGLDLQGSYAYSDSATDLPMLEVVGNPVAVNPDKVLRRIAIERDWTIEVFRNPVTLRDRLPPLRAPELNPAGAVAAAVGVAGIAAAVWWITRKSTRRSE